MTDCRNSLKVCARHEAHPLKLAASSELSDETSPKGVIKTHQVLLGYMLDKQIPHKSIYIYLQTDCGIDV